MSRTRISGPVVDLAIGEARQELSGENLPFGTKITGRHWEAVLVRVNAAAGAEHGAFCFINPAGVNHDAVPATNANVAALASATDRAAAVCGYIQTDDTLTTPVAAVDNDAAWLVTRQTDPDQTDIAALAENAITAGAQVTTTTTPGAMDDVGGVGTFDIEHVSVKTDPASGIPFSAITWDNPKLAGVAN